MIRSVRAAVARLMREPAPHILVALAAVVAWTVAGAVAGVGATLGWLVAIPLAMLLGALAGDPTIGNALALLAPWLIAALGLGFGLVFVWLAAVLQLAHQRALADAMDADAPLRAADIPARIRDVVAPATTIVLVQALVFVGGIPFLCLPSILSWFLLFYASPIVAVRRVGGWEACVESTSRVLSSLNAMLPPFFGFAAHQAAAAAPPLGTIAVAILMDIVRVDLVRSGWLDQPSGQSPSIDPGSDPHVTHSTNAPSRS